MLRQSMMLRNQVEDEAIQAPEEEFLDTDDLEATRKHDILQVNAEKRILIKNLYLSMFQLLSRLPDPTVPHVLEWKPLPYFGSGTCRQSCG